MNGGGHVTKTGSALIAAAAILAGLVTAAESQNFPIKPIRVVASEPGGGGDFVARLIAQGMSGGLGQQVLVDNRGGSVIIPAEIVAKAPADGYTLLLIGSTLWIEPLMRKTPYDPVRDFAPVSWVVGSPNILVVHPSLPVKSVKDLVALAQARPGELNHSVGIAGSSSQLASQLFKAMAGINMVSIPYKGIGPALTALVAGQVQVSFANPSAVSPHLKSGRLRALAVTSAQSSGLFPDLPTVAATLAGYESVSMFGMFAPARTPTPIVDRLNQEISRALGTVEIKEKFIAAGIETVASSPDRLAAAIKSEMARMGKVIRDAGIRAE